MDAMTSEEAVQLLRAEMASRYERAAVVMRDRQAERLNEEATAMELGAEAIELVESLRPLILEGALMSLDHVRDWLLTREPQRAERRHGDGPPAH